MSNIWRRDRDSNPGRLSPQRFSRPPHSTTLPPLHIILAPQDGLEPPTQALTVPCSTTELLGNNKTTYLNIEKNSFVLVVELTVGPTRRYLSLSPAS